MAGPIEVRKHGKAGPEVVVLHGGPGAQGSVASLASSMATWARVSEPLCRRSGTLPLTMEQHAEDLAAVAPASAAYVGWSWGAMLGLTFASLFPERVKTLVLVGCGAYDEIAREEYKRRLREALGDDGWARYDDLYRRMLVTEDPEWKDALLRQIGEVIERAQAVEPVGMTSTDTSPDADGYFETWGDVIRLQREGIEPARFSSIRCPALMIHGERDPHPGHLIRDALQVHVGHLAYIGIHACGHVPWYERFGREPFFGTLKQWIGELG